MKKRLVKYEAFEKEKENSLATVVNELVEAQEHLSRTLGTNSLVLEAFNDTNVIYQKDDGNFIKANYSVEDDAVTFDNLEELVIDEASETNKRREVVSSILEAILEEKEAEAQTIFEKYMQLASTKHRRDGSLLPPEEIDEAHVRLYGTRGKGGTPKVSVRTGSKNPKKVAAAKKAHRLHSTSYKTGGRKRHANLAKERSRRSSYSRSYGHLHSLSGGKQYTRGRKNINEWLTLTNNVFEYVDFIENGYILQESIVRTDEKGEVTAVKIPSTKTRNEGKILKMHYDKMIKQDSPKVMRETGLRLAHDVNFAAAMAELKRHNNLSDNEALEETLNKIVRAFPAVLYLTQEELAKSIGYALENAGVTNCVDEQCNFMAEGILRTAHNLYEERVTKLFTLAKAELKENEDAFDAYKKVTLDYFPTLDETIQTEQKVFEDLYNAVLDVRKFALESQNEEVRVEANELVSELEKVLKGEIQGHVDFAVEVADWLQGIAEANLPGSSEKWDLPKKPHHTVTGDHPQMSKNAKVAGIPGDYPGDWTKNGYSAQIGQDSNSWNHGDETRNRSWGNKGPADSVWPGLKNPNIPSPFGDYTMKGEKSVQGTEDNFGTWQSGDTWSPGEGGLQNPYLLKSQIPYQKVDPQGRLD